MDGELRESGCICCSRPMMCLGTSGTRQERNSPQPSVQVSGPQLSFLVIGIRRTAEILRGLLLKYAKHHPQVGKALSLNTIRSRMLEDHPSL